MLHAIVYLRDFHVHCASCDYKFENLIHAVVVFI